ncbi:unnamed protein product [Nippostrongylus brasiliensis]|uniref:Uncharacterized protein n=1 Tax=Nippostrongylus brasiliensis TaxID=27835 RepID=A0A0N4YZ75_NIPBR|nr:unnamed protein product [Nippostrongylus brasiliensis]
MCYAMSDDNAKVCAGPELDEASDLCVSIQQLLESRHETDPADINFVQPLVQVCRLCRFF